MRQLTEISFFLILIFFVESIDYYVELKEMRMVGILALITLIFAVSYTIAKIARKTKSKKLIAGNKKSIA